MDKLQLKISAYQAKGQRYGQAVFNAVHDLDMALAESVMDTEMDPFYIDERAPILINMFYERNNPKSDRNDESKPLGS